jgi:hypothetical protein
MDKKKSSSGGWFVALVVLGILHWSIAGWMANNLFQECNQRSNKFNPILCDCTKSAFKRSPYLEFFLIGSALDDKGIGNKVAQGLINSKQRCKIELGL